MVIATADDIEKAEAWWEAVGCKIKLEELAEFRAEARADERERLVRMITGRAGTIVDRAAQRKAADLRLLRRAIRADYNP